MDFRPDKIDDGVWFGRVPIAPEEWRALRDLGVTDVISLMTEEESLEMGLHPRVVFHLAVTNRMVLHRFGIRDASTSALTELSPRVISQMEVLVSQGRKIYLHCRHGLYRSATVAAAWIAKRRNLDIEHAKELLNEIHGPCLPDHDALTKICGQT